jgi:hypothetical protein
MPGLLGEVAGVVSIRRFPNLAVRFTANKTIFRRNDAPQYHRSLPGGTAGAIFPLRAAKVARPPSPHPWPPAEISGRLGTFLGRLGFNPHEANLFKGSRTSDRPGRGAGPGVGLLRRGCLGLQLYPLMRVGDAAIEPPSLAASRPAQSAGSWGLCQPSDVRRSPLEKCARQASAVS